MPKNTDGLLGPICNNCGGFGFTGTLTGASTGCSDCEQSGIQLPSRSEMAQKIAELEKRIEKLEA